MNEELDPMIDAAATALVLDLDPAWRDSIRFHLALSLLMGAGVLAFDLPDDLDPAPAFHA